MPIIKLTKKETFAPVGKSSILDTRLTDQEFRALSLLLTFFPSRHPKPEDLIEEGFTTRSQAFKIFKSIEEKGYVIRVDMNGKKKVRIVLSSSISSLKITQEEVCDIVQSEMYGVHDSAGLKRALKNIELVILKAEKVVKKVRNTETKKVLDTETKKSVHFGLDTSIYIHSLNTEVIYTEQDKFAIAQDGDILSDSLDISEGGDEGGLIKMIHEEIDNPNSSMHNPVLSNIERPEILSGEKEEFSQPSFGDHPPEKSGPFIDGLPGDDLTTQDMINVMAPGSGISPEFYHQLADSTIRDMWKVYWERTDEADHQAQQEMLKENHDLLPIIHEPGNKDAGTTNDPDISVLSDPNSNSDTIYQNEDESQAGAKDSGDKGYTSEDHMAMVMIHLNTFRFDPSARGFNKSRLTDGRRKIIKKAIKKHGLHACLAAVCWFGSKYQFDPKMRQYITIETILGRPTKLQEKIDQAGDDSFLDEDGHFWDESPQSKSGILHRNMFSSVDEPGHEIIKFLFEKKLYYVLGLLQKHPHTNEEISRALVGFGGPDKFKKTLADLNQPWILDSGKNLLETLRKKYLDEKSARNQKSTSTLHNWAKFSKSTSMD